MCLSRYVLFILCFIPGLLLAQTKPGSDTELWPQYYFNFSLNSKWSASVDYSNRYSGLFEKETQWIGRVGLSYKLNKTLNASAGYAYSEYFTSSGVRMENRPWQQVQFIKTIGKLKLTERFKLEERFQKDISGNRFNYRLRFSVQGLIPVAKDEKLALSFSEEPMINQGRQLFGNRFDQNRLQGGLQVKLTKNVFLTPSYLYIYQYQPLKSSYRNVNVWRTGITYSR